MDEGEVMAEMANEANGELPLVTFALFAYNQEKYIRDALEGAFSQTYESLEIILSDDCSTDTTFDIMQEVVADYRGPHKVILRQNAFNLGTALHVQSVFSESSGELVVVAAGDDISVPDRVRSLYDVWAGAGYPDGVVHSGRECFRNGQVIERVPAKRTPYSDHALHGYARSYWLPAAAPTCAYTRSVFECFGPLIGGSIIEDAPLQFRAALIGSFVPCDKPLVRQRLHDENGGTGYTIDSPVRWNRFIQSKVIAFRTMQVDLSKWGGGMDLALRCQIEGRLLAVLRSTPGLLLPEARPLGAAERLRIALRIVNSPAIARSLRLRFEYALSFFGISIHVRLKSRLRRWLQPGKRTQ